MSWKRGGLEDGKMKDKERGEENNRGGLVPVCKFLKTPLARIIALTLYML
jgi:hypothetical protein